ncbi:sugar phosphate isomerase/epimerase and 4-hydroxyphenylpyruvate domain-containing protein [uncultured Kushneria sp.]|uniref:bifunctional sugar phosphate isomerase/epimerase/4-hydroxyphenylpyruvate dioxygenase family protein n=1 Tax=uncultured Kushneria sp. TaxID=905033 RepID=UPI00260766EB|nr:sugar phosphate isomerase/epimerase and 4-hydroxyphenylpyruvate domain-containing protein [uncultured Kushneria sp.]
MRSIATVSISGDLSDKLEAIARAGFQGVEIFENDLLSWGGTPEEVREMATSQGLSITALQPFRDFEGMPEPQRRRNFERAERKFDLMKALGTDFMLVCSNTSPQSSGEREQIVADLRELAERAHAHGLRIGFEALAWGRHINDYRDAWEMVQRADHPALGLVLDSFHALAPGLSTDPIAEIPGDRIFLVHLADAPLLDMDLLNWSRHYRCFPGQGRLNIEAFMKALGRTGYNGPLSHEIFNTSFRTAPPRDTALDGMRSMILVENMAPNTPYFSSLPPSPVFNGIHFLEFTVDEERAAPLKQMIAALGFRHIGHHRSKNIQLWRQGDLHLVLNMETDSFAHTFRLVHGISVCAIGVRDNDPLLTMARARAFKARSHEGPVGPGELQIPALRGMENSLIYLVDPETARDRQWQTDFELFETPRGAEAGIAGVDHLSTVVAPTQLLGWQLLFKTVFDFEAGSEHELVDPHGLVVSQAMTSRDGTIRLPLNVSSAQETLPGRFMSEGRGGIQQIALGTHDIFATIDQLVANGLVLLGIPANYYDDLAARFDLDDAVLEAMRARNILYDRNEEGGEFLHAYTDFFADRFYFEIVERRGDYHQFGAVNAPIRLAAQSRHRAQRS